MHGVAYEGNAGYGVVSRERYGRRAVIELADIPGGYGWVFAKGEHVNVGVGAWQSEGPRIREHLARVCRAHDLEPSQLESVRGHRLPLRRPGVRIARRARCSSATAKTVLVQFVVRAPDRGPAAVASVEREGWKTASGESDGAKTASCLAVGTHRPVRRG